MLKASIQGLGIVFAVFMLLALAINTKAQDVPDIVPGTPVVIPGGQPEIWYLEWFMQDLESYGFTEALKIALGYGRNEDGWFEAVLVFELKFSRPDAERTTRDLYRLFFGEPEFVPYSFTF